jgi:aminoglycoside phosphotransferase (APT) family kinase protein
VLAEPESRSEPRFIHRDFQHFNLLWSRRRLTGVVDWGSAASGPPDMDVGHCRLNLAVLYDADWAERFRLACQARAGQRTDPWWELYALALECDFPSGESRRRRWMRRPFPSPRSLPNVAQQDQRLAG